MHAKRCRPAKKSCFSAFNAFSKKNTSPLEEEEKKNRNKALRVTRGARESHRHSPTLQVIKPDMWAMTKYS